MKERLLTIDEIAKYLQVSTKTVYRMIHRRQIPCYKVANQWRFRWDVIQEWMEKDNYRAMNKDPQGDPGADLGA
jgi:excisionase family DNA binding protein